MFQADSPQPKNIILFIVSYLSLGTKSYFYWCKILEYFVYFFTRELEWRDGPNFCLQGNIYNVNCSSEIFPYMTNLEKRFINIRFLFSFVHSQNLEIKRKKKLHGSVVHLGVVCEHPSSGTLMVHKSSLIINWQCTNEKLWNLFFLPFCFLSTRHMSGLGEEEGWGGGGLLS